MSTTSPSGTGGKKDQSKKQKKNKKQNKQKKSESKNPPNGIHITECQLIGVMIVCIVAIYVAFVAPQSVQEMEPWLKRMAETLHNATNEHIDKFNKSYFSLTPSEQLLSTTNFTVHEKHPIVMIPGLTSTPLVLWTSKKPHATTPEIEYFNEKCGSYIKRSLRQRIWGSTKCAVEMASNINCWLLSMILNETTGLDSAFTKLRAAEGGTGAIDWLFGMIWIWAPIINNLAEIGYDSNLLYVASYDWRLSFRNLEVRDLYFTKLRREIEDRVRLNGEKALILGHSMGGNVAYYFLNWVNMHDAQWLDKHVEATLFLAAPLLGVPKYVSMALSGECLETLLLPPAVQFIKEWMIPRPYFNRFARSVHGAMYMQPLGGNTIWGNKPVIAWKKDIDSNDETQTGQDEETAKEGNTHTDEEDAEIFNVGQYDDMFAQMLLQTASAKEEGVLKQIIGRNSTTDTWREDTLQIVDEQVYRHLTDFVEVGFPDKKTNISDDEAYGNDKYFGNPLWRPLPNAKEMKIYCLYGTGLKAETGYYYKRDSNATFKYPFRIDEGVQLEEDGHGDGDEKVVNGVRLGDGDGTVPLISLGFMCGKAWKHPRWNPHALKVTTVEYENVEQSFIYKGTMRGGGKTGEHLDILGNDKLIKDILLIASGNGDKVKDTFVSNIQQISQHIDINFD